jgi:hypothetical protein
MTREPVAGEPPARLRTSAIVALERRIITLSFFAARPSCPASGVPAGSPLVTARVDGPRDFTYGNATRETAFSGCRSGSHRRSGC